MGSQEQRRLKSDLVAKLLPEEAGEACGKCLVEFPSATQLQSHRNAGACGEAEGLGPERLRVRCLGCRRSFASLWALLQKHGPPCEDLRKRRPKYSDGCLCLLCGRGLPRTAALLHHLKDQHPETHDGVSESVPCPFCPEGKDGASPAKPIVFARLSDALQHLCTHPSALLLYDTKDTKEDHDAIQDHGSDDVQEASQTPPLNITAPLQLVRKQSFKRRRSQPSTSSKGSRRSESKESTPRPDSKSKESTPRPDSKSKESTPRLEEASLVPVKRKRGRPSIVKKDDIVTPLLFDRLAALSGAGGEIAASAEDTISLLASASVLPPPPHKKPKIIHSRPASREPSQPPPLQAPLAAKASVVRVKAEPVDPEFPSALPTFEAPRVVEPPALQPPPPTSRLEVTKAVAEAKTEVSGPAESEEEVAAAVRECLGAALRRLERPGRARKSIRRPDPLPQELLLCQTQLPIRVTVVDDGPESYEAEKHPCPRCHVEQGSLADLCVHLCRLGCTEWRQRSLPCPYCQQLVPALELLDHVATEHELETPALVRHSGKGPAMAKLWSPSILAMGLANVGSLCRNQKCSQPQILCYARERSLAAPHYCYPETFHCDVRRHPRSNSMCTAAFASDHLRQLHKLLFHLEFSGPASHITFTPLSTATSFFSALPPTQRPLTANIIYQTATGASGIGSLSSKLFQPHKVIHINRPMPVEEPRAVVEARSLVALARTKIRPCPRCRMLLDGELEWCNHVVSLSCIVTKRLVSCPVCAASMHPQLLFSHVSQKSHMDALGLGWLAQPSAISALRLEDNLALLLAASSFAPRLGLTVFGPGKAQQQCPTCHAPFPDSDALLRLHDLTFHHTETLGLPKGSPPLTLTSALPSGRPSAQPMRGLKTTPWRQPKPLAQPRGVPYLQPVDLRRPHQPQQPAADLRKLHHLQTSPRGQPPVALMPRPAATQPLVKLRVSPASAGAEELRCQACPARFRSSAGARIHFATHHSTNSVLHSPPLQALVASFFRHWAAITPDPSS